MIKSEQLMQEKFNILIVNLNKVLMDLIDFRYQFESKDNDTPNKSDNTLNIEEEKL